MAELEILAEQHYSEGFIMTTDMQKQEFNTSFSGLGNYDTQLLTRDIPATSLGAFSFQDFTMNYTLPTTDTLIQAQVNYQGIEDVWRVIGGLSNLIYIPSFSAATDTIITSLTQSGTAVTVTCRVTNPTAGTKSSPAFTLNAKLFLFTAPFDI